MKKVLIAILGLIVLVLVGATLILPREVPVERKVVVDAAPDRIYPYLVDLKKWQEWNAWAAKDPNMKVTYGEKVEGEGASYSWVSETQGSGSMTITKVIEPTRVETKMDFGDQGTATAYFELKNTGDDKTEVTWHMVADMGSNPIGKIFGLMMDGMVGPDFEDGLQRLKKLSESAPEPQASATPVATPTP
jgi:polyketide cyclase/dehydrase/lipid transport protein